MNRSILLSGLLLLVVCLAPKARSQAESPAAPVLSIHDRTAWWMKGDRVLRFENDGARVRLVDALGVTIVPFAYGETAKEVVLSSDRTRMLVLAMMVQAFPNNTRAFNYSRLVLVSLSGSGGFSFRDFFKHNTPPMNQLHRWIGNVRSISDDGKTARVRFGEADVEQAPYRMSYRELEIDLWKFDPFETPPK